MAEYTVHDSGGNVVGYFSNSPGAGCVGCLGLSIIAAIIWGGMSLYQVVQSRLADSKIEAQRVVLNSDTLNLYSGEYNYGRYKIKVERRGDKLFNISNEEFCELMPISTQEFIYKNCVNGFQGRAQFVRDGQGQLTLVVIHKDGRQERALRIK
jgi:hypothetical protein